MATKKTTTKKIGTPAKVPGYVQDLYAALPPKSVDAAGPIKKGTIGSPAPASKTAGAVLDGITGVQQGPGIGDSPSVFDDANTKAAVDAATAVNPNQYYMTIDENGNPRPMTEAEVALEKAREAGVFYGSDNAGMNAANIKKYEPITKPDTGKPYVYNAPDAKKEGMSDAYALLIATFKMYGLEELVDPIMDMMNRGLGANEAGLEIRKTDAYKTRFHGNDLRRDAGLNVLSEAEYLDLENSYSSTLQAYGLRNYFGPTLTKAERAARTAKIADIIGNDISAVEFKDRIDTVVTRVNNSDPAIKKTLQAFYNIGDTDLIGYFLNPKEGLPKLQEKVTSAEIGTEFLKQGLTTGVTSAEEFAKLGIDKAAAAKGAADIASVLPESKKLGQIYKEEGIDYSQKTAEEEVFKNSDAARRKRLRLAEKEVASFSGSSGMGQYGLKSQTRGLL